MSTPLQPDDQRSATVARTVARPAAGAGLRRRQFLRYAGAAGAALALPAGVAACRSEGGDGGGGGSGRAIKIGYVSPQTGALAGFGEADGYVVDGVKDRLGDGLMIGGTAYPIEIIVKDSQSDPNRAATVAGELINSDQIDVMVVAHTPENANPVADQCEANGIPCVSSVVPWQPYVLGRTNNDITKSFKWTYHFFWGLEDIIAVFTDLWGQVDTNKRVAALWPNDGDGNAWGSPEVGFPPALAKAGYRISDPGRYQNGADDFSSQISRFKDFDAEIVTGVPIPPDWTNFWQQAAQQGFKPKIASVGKALLFPAAVEALGDIGEGMSTEVWWSPKHPFTSSLSGETAQQLADGYTAKTSKQWTQPIGFVHALFEVATDALKRAGGPDDKQKVVDAVKATNLDTIVGKVQWTGQPHPNVAKTPLVGGQWKKGTTFKYEMVIVSNSAAPQIPTGGTLDALGA
jgi:branched-chain amino acid transport system substrate-binding protein